MRSARLHAAALAACLLPFSLQAQTPAPKLIQQNGRHALLVEGSPYLALGAQINNSSAWPSVLPEVWPALEAAHVNTAEAPVYWEQMERKPGIYDWANVDALLDGARAHNLHLILLWFGTWKNGNNHYAPLWVKQDPKRFPPVQNRYGTLLDVLSANSQNNLDADRKAFTALMHHLAQRDADQHTVLMIQVENESGIVGSVRDFSPEANREFAGQVPPDLLRITGKRAGTWSELFGGAADETFQAWFQARYVNAIAEAGKHEFNIPMYCNVWLAYPPAQLPERHIPTPGIDYPSGGPVQTMLALWKAAAPAIDLIGPDLYSSAPEFYTDILHRYSSDGNALWIPESGDGDAFAPIFFAALGDGAIGFSPFGIDWTGWTFKTDAVPKQHAANFALLSPMDRTAAELNLQGKLRTAVEAVAGSTQQIVFSNGSKLPYTPESPVEQANATVPLDDIGNARVRAADADGMWVAEVRFGNPRGDGQPAPGTAKQEGRMLVAQLGHDEFLLTGIGGSVRFRRPGLLPGIRMQILRAEEGYYSPASQPGGPEVWHMTRLLNGDQTDRGIQFPEEVGTRPIAVRILVGRL